MTEGKSAICVGTPVENTRRILRRSVAGRLEKEAKEEAEEIKCKEIKEKSRELFLGNVRNSWKKMKRIGKN